MNPFLPFGMAGFDPSKMDPKLLMELSQLVQQLPPEQLSRMQTLMHNAMAGFDIRREMEEFEKSLPAGFREKIVRLVGAQGGHSSPINVSGGGNLSQDQAGFAKENDEGLIAPSLDIHEARLTILQAVADGKMSPSEAEKVLFS